MKFSKTLALTFLVSTAACAYEPGPCTHNWWVNLGVGQGVASTGYHLGREQGPAAQLSFNGMLTEHLFLSIESTALSATRHGPDINEGGVLLGYKSTHPNWYWSAAAGIAHLKVEQDYYYGWWSKKESAAVPVNLQLFYTPFQHFGFGLIAHGAMGGGSRYGALMLALQVY